MRKRSSSYRLIRAAVPAFVIMAMALAAPGTASASTSLRAKNTLGSSTSKTDPPLSFGVWTDFNIGGPGSRNFEGAFTFYSKDPVLLRVTDGLCRGDSFRVFDRGFAIFKTSKVAIDPSCDDVPFVFWPSGAWQDQTYSKGSFLLEPGWHSIRIQAVNSPFGGGTGWLEAMRQPVG